MNIKHTKNAALTTPFRSRGPLSLAHHEHRGVRHVLTRAVVRDDPLAKRRLHLQAQPALQKRRAAGGSARAWAWATQTWAWAWRGRARDSCATQTRVR